MKWEFLKKLEKELKERGFYMAKAEGNASKTLCWIHFSKRKRDPIVYGDIDDFNGFSIAIKYSPNKEFGTCMKCPVVENLSFMTPEEAAKEIDNNWDKIINLDYYQEPFKLTKEEKSFLNSILERSS